MAVREFVKDIISSIKKEKPKEKRDVFLDVGKRAVCRKDGSKEELLRCLIQNAREFDGEMMVCVSERDLPKSDAVLRATARRFGVNLSIKKRVKVDGVKDAICIKMSKIERKKLLRELS